MKRALIALNLALLILYPIAWNAPLARAAILPFFSGSELTIFGGVADLWRTDIFLATIVAIFAVLAPYLKTILLAAVHLRLVGGDRWFAALEFAGKLSMADVFLLAVYIVAIKGVGIGHVETAWGLYLFTALVLSSLFIALGTRKLAEAAS